MRILTDPVKGRLSQLCGYDCCRYFGVRFLVESWRMRAILVIFLTGAFLARASAQEKAFVKFITPDIPGISTMTGFTGYFEVDKVQFSLQSLNSKESSGTLSFTMKENFKSPLLWKEYLNPAGFVSMELVFAKIRENKLTPFLVVKLKDSVISSFNSADKDNEMSIWVSEFAYRYSVLSENGTVLSNHSTGWNFIRNVKTDF